MSAFEPAVSNTTGKNDILGCMTACILCILQMGGDNTLKFGGEGHPEMSEDEILTRLLALNQERVL
ncbi:MAG TPA: hypothetical protein EYP05_08850 [Piscirickettsiaceae bacterium]|nr:hypothetical protein [Piscirickettsiaceae bacterium]